MQQIEKIIIGFADVAWGPWLLVLLLGGGAFFLCYSRFLPFRFIQAWHVNILRGKYDDPSDPGDISHFAALSRCASSNHWGRKYSRRGGCCNGGGAGVPSSGCGLVPLWAWQRSSSPVPSPLCIEGQDSRGTAQGGADVCNRRRARKKMETFGGVLLRSGSDRCLARVPGESACSDPS